MDAIFSSLGSSTVPTQTKEQQPTMNTRAARMLEALREDEDAVATFNALDPARQHVVFRRLWDDYTRLLETERNSRLYLQRCPIADRDLYSGPSQQIMRRRGAEDEPDPDDEEEEHLIPPETNYYIVATLPAMWNYQEPFIVYPDPLTRLNWMGDAVSRNPPADHVAWCDDNLYTVTDLEGKTEVHISGRPADGRSDTLSGVISSQLLLYRLITVFGMPPQDTPDPHESSWEVNFKSPDEESYLKLCEKHAGAYVEFSGSERASSNALELINYLISEDIPCPFDVHLAGSRIR